MALPFTVLVLSFTVLSLPFTVRSLPFTVRSLPFTVLSLPFRIAAALEQTADGGFDEARVQVRPALNSKGYYSCDRSCDRRSRVSEQSKPLFKKPLGRSINAAIAL